MRTCKAYGRSGVEAQVLRVISLCIAGLLAASTPSSAQDAPSLKQVLQRVQDNISEFERTLPDFVCDETITSSEAMGQKIQQERTVESTFMGLQRKVETGTPFTESREIRTIDGRPAAPGQQLNVPFVFGGGFSSILDEIFARENAPYFKYKRAGTETVDGRTTVVVLFETHSGQNRLLYRDLFGQQALLKGKGKSWIDLESMNVIRLELEYLDPPAGQGALEVSVDYAPVAINDKTFWMPRKVTAEQVIPNPKFPVSGHYIAEYSNYHQFNVSHKMLPPETAK